MFRNKVPSIIVPSIIVFRTTRYQVSLCFVPQGMRYHCASYNKVPSIRYHCVSYHKVFVGIIVLRTTRYQVSLCFVQRYQVSLCFVPQGCVIVFHTTRDIIVPQGEVSLCFVQQGTKYHCVSYHKV